MLIREITPKDAERLIKLIRQVEAESDFMLMEAGERKTTPEQQQKQLERMEKQNNSTIFVAEQKNGDLAGYLIVIGGGARRTRHSAYLVIGILKEYRGQGLGTQLFQRLEEWARTHDILRLELTAVTKNDAGVSLYKKMGFEIEGIKRNSLMIDGKLSDEYFMAKLM